MTCENNQIGCLYYNATSQLQSISAGSLDDAIQQVNDMRTADNLALYDPNNVIEVYSTPAEESIAHKTASEHRNG